MANIDELFNTSTVLNYYKTRQLKPLLGESLFPPMKIQDIKLDMITGADGLPVAATIHAFDWSDPKKATPLEEIIVLNEPPMFNWEMKGGISSEKCKFSFNLNVR